ncbi:hypothetical protein [Halonatronum saccharophilum]|nr:hypothetical protein [Halonatronum saccharophilum]
MKDIFNKINLLKARLYLEGGENIILALKNNRVVEESSFKE